MSNQAPLHAARADYYRRIDGLNLSPLWENLHTLVPTTPDSPCAPALWRFDEIRPYLMQGGELITAREAVRRVLVLENPALRGSSRVTKALYAGLQLILPGEVAPSHRHTQSALRFVVEGRGAYTAVDGERHTMEPGDFIITPSWTFHDHGNPGSEPVIWLDGLDIPLVDLCDARFAENHPLEVQPVTKAEGQSLARFGNNMAPVGYAPTTPTSPIFAYPYRQSRAALHALARADAPDPAHGHKLQYINPLTGGSAMPTIGTFLQWLPADFDGARHRSTDATVFSVVEGRGEVVLDTPAGREVIEFGPRDHFVIPSWTPHALRAATDTVLFSFSDRPVQRLLGLLREETLA